MDMKRWKDIVIVLGISLLVGTSVYAVGSGGGGSVRPTDPEPVNSNTENTNASNTNTNTNASNTNTANTNSTNTNTTSTTTTNTNNININTNASAEPQEIPSTSEPVEPTTQVTNDCTEDIWTCDEWSACDTYGNEERTCTLIKDCATDTATVEPDKYQPCTTLQCGNKTDLRERVACRLNLTPLAMSRELAIQYLPEECRALTDTIEQTACIERYRSYQPCWGFASTEERVSCARDILQLQENIADDIAACESTECLIDLQDRVYQLIKFRFYELEERSEELAERGANIDEVTDFIVLIINKKSEFNAATTTDQRRQAIIDVRDGWNTFLTKVTPDIR